MPTGVAARLGEIRDRIAAAAVRVGRRPEAIRLIAVSKGQPPEMVREALMAGQVDFGENYQQELSAKAAALLDAEPSPRWHYQGTLQRRKIREILNFTRSILSVARIEELEEIEKRANQAMEGPRPRGPEGSIGENEAMEDPRPRGSEKVECCIEVNIARESQKNGVLPDDLAALLERASALKNLEIKGLMCVPPAEGDPRPWFTALRELGARHHLRELSMGMSDDFETAIEEGATMVRIGTAIFGTRQV